MIKLYGGDCLDVLKKFPTNHFSTLITDPPYGLEFMGKDWDGGIPGVRFWKEFLRVCKPGAFALVFGGTRTFHRLTCAIEDAGWEIRDCMMWLYGSGFPKSHDISKAIDKAKGAERKSLGKDHARAGRLVNQMEHSNPTGTWQAGKRCVDITAPATDLAKQWDGYGTALKPAWEPIIVAMKPLDGTFAQNAERWGVGGLWIDGGRIGHSDKIGKRSTGGFTAQHGIYSGSDKYEIKNQDYDKAQGRWPANLILDEEAAELLGQPSRFFYVAKASRSERNEGLEGMETKDVPYTEYRENAKGTKSHVTNYPDGSPRPMNKTQNNHPTVKPLKLMEYLCRLTRTSAGGIVLDPFGGSGTTALACMNTGRGCVIIEKEPGYCELIRGRVRGNATKKN